MMRIILGWLLILHGVAHAYAGTWSSSRRSIWPLTIMWAIASIAYLVAGMGLLRAPWFRRWWKPAIVLATATSMLMIIGYRPPWGMAGFVADLVLWIATIGALQPRLDADITVAVLLGDDTYRHPRWVRAGWLIGTAAVTYAAAALMLRPVFLRWGTTADERMAALSGDEVHPPNATYHIDHAITIRAPVSAVRPWIIGLENRGTFVLSPIDSNTTRLIVRTRGLNAENAAGFLLAPVTVFVFEPAHFIMERAMLRGIRDRAERAVRGGLVGDSPTKKPPYHHAGPAVSGRKGPFLTGSFEPVTRHRLPGLFHRHEDRPPTGEYI